MRRLRPSCHSRYNYERNKAIHDEYKSGGDPHDIAERYGIQAKSVGSVARNYELRVLGLDDASIRLRKRRGVDRDIRKMFRRGHTLVQIAKKFRVCTKTVKNALNRSFLGE